MFGHGSQHKLCAFNISDRSDTRHTWASLLIQNGVPKGMVKEMGGWESDSMVERYAHLAPEHLARHAAVIDELLRPGGEPAPLQQIKPATKRS